MNELENKIVRLEVQVEGLTKEIHTVRNLLMAGQTPGHVALEEKVASLDRQLSKLDKTIESLGDKLEKSTRVPWAQLISAVSVIVTIAGGVIGFFISELKADNARFERELSDTRAIIVPRAEIETRSAQTQKRLERLEARPIK